MKLSELSQKPKLIRILIDKKEIVKKYGEELEFHIYDRQPLDVFTKLANVKEDTAGINVEFQFFTVFFYDLFTVYNDFY